VGNWKKNLQAARDAVDYVASGGGLPVGYDNTFIKVPDLDMRFKELNELKPRDAYEASKRDDELRIMSAFSDSFGLARVAFCYLKQERVRPLDFMEFERPLAYHAFVVIGRAKTIIGQDGQLLESDPLNYKTWGEDAAICDPLAGRAYLAVNLPIERRYIRSVTKEMTRVKSLYRLE